MASNGYSGVPYMKLAKKERLAPGAKPLRVSNDAGSDPPQELLPGTLDLRILKALARGAMHGYFDRLVVAIHKVLSAT